MKDSIIAKNIINRDGLDRREHDFKPKGYSIKNYDEYTGKILNLYKTGGIIYPFGKKPVEYFSIDDYQRMMREKSSVNFNLLERGLAGF